MGIEFQVSTKYLRSNQKKGFVSFISGVSMIGLVLGVMTLITVLSVMNGFHKELRERILGAISHSYITEFGDILYDWEEVRSSINKHPQVIDSSPYIQAYGLLNTHNKLFILRIYFCDSTHSALKTVTYLSIFTTELFM